MKIEVPDIWQSIKKVDEGLLSELTRNNPWFAIEALALPDPAKVPASVHLAMAVTKLDFLVAQIQNPSYKLALQWLNKMMQLPRELRLEIDKL